MLTQRDLASSIDALYHYVFTIFEIPVNKLKMLSYLDLRNTIESRQFHIIQTKPLSILKIES